MADRLNVINVIIGLCVLVFGFSALVPGMGEVMNKYLALHFPENKDFRLWQLVSNMFMHGGFMHLFLNMYALFMFGSPFEHIWGKSRFLLFYFACGIGAAVIYTGVNYINFNAIYNELIQAGLSPSAISKILETGSYNTSILSSVSAEELRKFYTLFHISAVGASGAIYGILVAFGFTFPEEKLALIFLPIPIAAKYFIPVLIALDLFSGITGVSIFGGGIAHFAHVGGAIIGCIFMLLWRKKRTDYYRQDF
jgi:membrane associated rhomboid family serine protease